MQDEQKNGDVKLMTNMMKGMEDGNYYEDVEDVNRMSGMCKSVSASLMLKH
jgi:hypothetical protein